MGLYNKMFTKRAALREHPAGAEHPSGIGSAGHYVYNRITSICPQIKNIWNYINGNIN